MTSQPCFNSMKVRLMRDKQTVTNCNQLSFNSMKVRLKRYTNMYIANFHLKFQFHEGPIKTRF